MMQQDSSDPTGVSGPARKHNDPGNIPLKRARERKANAAVQLRLSGATWEQIAEALGYPTARQALVATEKALEKQLTTDPDRAKLRQLAGMRLERLLQSVWGKAVNPENPDHLLAATKAREIIAQHAKLYGLDAPTEVVVHSPTRSEIEDWVARVVAVSVPEVEEYDIFEGEFTEDVPELEAP